MIYRLKLLFANQIEDAYEEIYLLVLTETCNGKQDALLP